MIRLSHFVVRHKLAVALFWFVTMIGGFAFASVVSDRLTRDVSLPGRDGYEANAAILRLYGTGGVTNPLVPVITLPEGTTVDSPGVEQGLEKAFTGLAEQHGVRVVSYPSTGDRGFASSDGRTIFAVVSTPPQQGAESTDLAPAVTGSLSRALPQGTTVRVTGLDQIAAELGERPSTDGDTGVLFETLVGALGALVVLAFVFGSLLALLPLVIAAVSILSTFLLLLGLTAFTDILLIVQFLIALIGLGLAVDYSLLLVTRWREEQTHGHGREESVHRAMATAGRAVALSGFTVAVGLLVLVLLPVPFIRGIGLGSMLIPLVSMGVTLTLLPVILARLGPRLDRRALRKQRSATAGRLWTRWANAVARHPWLALLGALLITAPLVAAAFGMRLGSAPAHVLTGAGPAHQGLSTLDRSNLPSGALTPIEVLVPRGVDPTSVADRLADVDGVHTAVAPDSPAWRQEGTALVSVLPDVETSLDQGEVTVERVRGVVAADPPGVQVGGVGAQEIDVAEATFGSFPLMLAIIALATLALLARAFRSLVLAAQAILLNALSIGAAYGVLVLVWQNGYGSDTIWDIPALGALPTWVPPIVFAFLFGLSMDYEVFLLSRMREEYDTTGSTKAAIVAGLGRIGLLVTSAALILFLAFAALSNFPIIDIKIMATAFGAGILIDATVIRGLLVPALVALSGRWTWWLPAWSARILRVPPSSPPPEETPPRVPIKAKPH
jgi:putative drug exporter of the RND superfamily